jgi:hypothetical protein
MTTTTTLTELRAQWDAPFTGDAFDTAAWAARSALTRELAAAILAAPLAASRTQVGGMFIVLAGWSRERDFAVSAVALPGTPEWRAALGPHEHATLTSDGKGANRSKWCTCPNDDVSAADQWVRYEYWTAEGCERHGFVHSECRRLLQAG